MTGRKQYVFYNGVSSDVKYATLGFPQGFDYGPHLFLIYINDLANIFEKLNFFLFASCTNTYYESKYRAKLEKAVYNERKELSHCPNFN